MNGVERKNEGNLFISKLLALAEFPFAAIPSECKNSAQANAWFAPDTVLS